MNSTPCHHLPFCAILVALFVAGLLSAQGDKTKVTSKPQLTLNQSLHQGWYDDSVDPADVDAFFEYIFNQLDDEVTIYPSENYYYFKCMVAGREIWGNIRLPARSRDRGVVSFGYSDFVQFPSNPGMSPLSRSKYFTKADGIIVNKVDRFTYDVEYSPKKVRFHLHQLKQTPPKKFSLGPDEVFIQRTFDESGYQFFLIFNKKENFFLWVLNEEEPVTDHFKELNEEITVGNRSGFAFYIDKAHQNRKVLFAIRKISVNRNDYYDGPFDQLADNYVDETNPSKYMELAIPGIKGRIDKYGYYVDRERPVRVALSNYTTYYTLAELTKFIENAKKSASFYRYISRGGVPTPEEMKKQQEEQAKAKKKKEAEGKETSSKADGTKAAPKK